MTKNSMIFTALSFLLASLSYANDASHGINWWHLGSEYKDAPALGWLTITFLIFVFAIGRAIQKPLSLYLETRSKDIKHAIEEGQKAKKHGQEQLALYDQKLKSLSQEINKMKAVFEEHAEAEKKEKMRLAKEMETRIVRDTEDTIRANYARTKNKLAEEVISLAVQAAQKHLLENQREEMDQHLKKQLIADLTSHARDVN